jgi:flagellar basal-body rod protein FlgF
LRNDSRLSRFGNSGVMSSIPGEVVQDFNSTGVQQGYSEGSNVNPVLEMTKMIAVQRNFDSAATTIQESESTLMDAIRTLGPSS